MKSTVKPYTVTAEHLASGERLTVIKSIIKTKKRMIFSSNLSSLGEGKLCVCHGYMETNASWLEISKDGIEAHSYFSYANPPMSDLFRGAEIKHALDIKNDIMVIIDYIPIERSANLIIMSNGESFMTKIPGWYGHDGEAFVFFEGCEAENCKLSWMCDDYARKIWLVGDSYIGYGHGARWPYYLFRDGYTNLLMMGYPGMNSQRGIEEFRKIIGEGSPEFAVWCLGMNNGDSSDSEINEKYLESTKEFLKICAERGIEPILSTIPTTPKVNNNAKNNWVRSLPYRYIDFAHAVGADENPAWYDGMLSVDQVHPSVKGAAALYTAVIIDFPEITFKD